MTDTATATAAPLPITLGGQTYRMSPLSDRDIGEMDLWVSTRYLRRARASIDPNDSDENKRRAEEVAQRTAATMTFMSGLGLSMLNNVDGMAQLLWVSIRKNHPKAESADIRQALVEHPEDIEAAMADWRRLNPGRKSGPEPAKKNGDDDSPMKIEPLT